MRDEARFNEERLIELTLRHLDGSLYATETQELRLMLDSADAAMERFVELCVQARAMAEPLGASEAEPRPTMRIDVAAPQPWRRVTLGACAAAIGLIAAATAAVYLMTAGPVDEPEPHAASRPVAVLIDTGDTVFATTPRMAGDDLTTGPIAIDSGRLDIEFRGGAEVTMHGPGELSLIGADRCSLRRGRLSVRVEGGGFAVDLPDAIRVTDLGTAFDIEVADDGASTVHVTEGRVRIDRLGSIAGDAPAQSFELVTHQRCLVNADRFGKPVVVYTHRLVTPTAIAVVRGDTLAAFTPQNLITDAGFDTPPTLANYAAAARADSDLSRWATASNSYPNYFSADLPSPQFVIRLDAVRTLTHMVVWGYGGNTNEASDFLAEFSADGGVTWDGERESLATDRLLAHDSVALPLARPRKADTVRITITNNAGGRGFSGVGGDRVGLGAIRFIGQSSHDLRSASSHETVIAPSQERTERKDPKDTPPSLGETP